MSKYALRTSAIVNQQPAAPQPPNPLNARNLIN